jgi:hypothetical protein
MYGGAAVLDIIAHQEAVTPLKERGLTFSELYSYLDDVRGQPNWRDEADRAADYYDNNQTDPETLMTLRAKGMAALQKNIIKPIINTVLGMEAQSRSDWRVNGDSDESQPVAEALSAKLHEVERETRADRACSDAYAGQLKAGIGWVEVGRNTNPFDYPYRCQTVHRREVFWDWRDLTPELKQSRYLMRKRWFDLDQTIAYFPKFKDVLEAAVDRDPFRWQLALASVSPSLYQDLETGGNRLDFDQLEEWRYSDRRRVCLYEVWYRRWVRGYVLRLPNAEVVEFDPRNPLHKVLVSRGMVQPETAVYSRMRMSIWAGPVRLYDCACDRDHAPYIPFWGYREDRTGVPYGMIREMISQQDEVNARRRKLMWLLASNMLIMDSDALDTEANDIATVLAEISRPDAVIQLNPNRANRDGFVINNHLEKVWKLAELVKEAEQSAQEVVGVFNAIMGRDSAAKSGVAIDALVERGIVALADINDNYRFSRRLVGERLLDYIRQDLIGQQVTVLVGNTGRVKSIMLNQQVIDPGTGQAIVINDVRTARVKVSLEDIPSSPTYRQQQQVMLAEVMKGMPPELQAAIAPFWLEASNLQKRREMADAVRRTLGQSVEPQNEQEAQALAQQQALAQKQVEMQLQDAQLTLAEKQAKIEKMNADTAKIMHEIEAATRGDPTAPMRQEYERRLQEMQVKAREEMDRIAAELFAARQQAGQREQRLMGELSKAIALLKANASNYEAEVRKGEIEREIAIINAEKDKEIARLQSAQNDVVKRLEAEIARLRGDMTARAGAAQPPELPEITDTTVEAPEPARQKKRRSKAKPAASGAEPAEDAE